MEKLVDKAHPMYQKVQKVFDLINDLEIKFYIDKHNDLRVAEKGSYNEYYLDLKISGFQRNGWIIPIDNFQIEEYVCEDDEETIDDGPWYLSEILINAFENENVQLMKLCQILKDIESDKHLTEAIQHIKFDGKYIDDMSIDDLDKPISNFQKFEYFHKEIQITWKRT